MAPAQAAKLLFEETEAAPPLAEPHSDPFTTLREGIIDAVEQFDPRLLQRRLDHAASVGQPPFIVDRVLRPTLIEIGERWHDGRMTVAQEHLATEAIVATVHRMLPLVQPEGDARCALLACFADDEHTFALQALAVHLASWGWLAVILGARTPPAALQHAVRELRPSVVGLSCTVPPVGHRLRELVDGYADACDGTPWIIGGAASDALARLVIGRGGHIASDTEPKSIRTLIERVTTKSRSKKATP